MKTAIGGSGVLGLSRSSYRADEAQAGEREGNQVHRMERSRPPSARMAAPFVAEASGLARYVTMDATSSVVANLWNSELDASF